MTRIERQLVAGEVEVEVIQAQGALLDEVACDADRARVPRCHFLDELGGLLVFALFAFALALLEGRPLYVIALARPEAQELFPERWTGRLQQLVLPPLSRRASEQLVRHVLGGDVSNEALAQVVRLADGNAFYLEELIRATAEGWSALELPGSALAMVQSRLAGLDEPLRRALRAASVLGEIFWTGGVATLTGARPGETDALLRRLVELELVTPRTYIACRTIDRDPDPWRGLELVARSRDVAHAVGVRAVNRTLRRRPTISPGDRDPR